MSEAYTPANLVAEMLDSFPDEVWIEGKTFCDPECGPGNFLVAIIERKLILGHTYALDTLYGVDIMQDNVDECRERLLNICGDTNMNRAIVQHNIRCEDALEYDFSFE